MVEEIVEEMVFQSHYGAIATAQLRLRGKLKEGFQSHYGAIATAIVTNARVPPRPPFNPTMVRLQPPARGAGDISAPLSIPLWCDCN